MPTDIKLKNSVTATNAPTSLQQGEVAINITDKKVWVGNAATTPVLLLGSGADGTFTNLTVSGVASFADGTVSLPSITNIGDTNTGIFFPTADTIAFTEGGVESMRIDASGNLGVGTTTMTGRLNVNGNAHANNWYLGAGGTGDAGTIGMIAANGAFQSFYGSASSPANVITFGRSGTESMRIDSSGNLLIGTSASQARLTVVGGSIAPQAVPASFWGIDFAADGAGSPPNYITFTSNSTYDLASGSGLVVLHSNTNGAAALFLCYAGTVAKIGGEGNIVSGSVADNSNQVGLFYNGGTGAYRIKNGYTTSNLIFITTIRTRTAS